jgi:hypothetical protein
MGVKPFLLSTGFALLCACCAPADTITEPGHFTVNLNYNCGTDPYCQNPNGAGGWGDNTLFTDTVNTVTSTSGFTQGVCVPDRDQDDCGGSSAVGNDPRIRLDNGGGSSPFPSSFNADEKGGGLFDFQNDSNAPYTDVLFTTNFVGTETYSCASGVYSFCGFDVIHEMNGPDQLEILFIGGSIPSAVPEPSPGLFLLVAGTAAIWVHRGRSRRISA